MNFRNMKIDKFSLFLSIVIVFSILLWISSCRHGYLLNSDIPDICFKKEVYPIFMNNCAISGCHDGQGESELLLNDSLSIRNAVVPGDPKGSSAYQAIVSKSGENKMPPDRPLSLENRTIIRLWIEQGAKITVCSGTPIL